MHNPYLKKAEGYFNYLQKQSADEFLYSGNWHLSCIKKNIGHQFLVELIRSGVKYNTQVSIYQ